jgi:hypothetical protein
LKCLSIIHALHGVIDIKSGSAVSDMPGCLWLVAVLRIRMIFDRTRILAYINFVPAFFSKKLSTQKWTSKQSHGLKVIIFSTKKKFHNMSLSILCRLGSGSEQNGPDLTGSATLKFRILRR